MPSCMSRGLAGRGAAYAPLLLVALHGAVVFFQSGREMMAPVVLRNEVEVLDRCRVHCRLKGPRTRVCDRARRETQSGIGVVRRGPTEVRAGQFARKVAHAVDDGGIAL